MSELARIEYDTLQKRHDDLYTKLPELLVPPSQTTGLSALVELKPGVGGSESSLFCQDLLRMYSRWATLRGWTAKPVALEEREGGGLKHAMLEIAGGGAYEWLRWESGVHRVQRVPATESAGRVHTSTVQVIVSIPWIEVISLVALIHQILPHTEENFAPTMDKLYDEKDVRVEVMRARGAGGQVSISHLALLIDLTPFVACQQNRVRSSSNAYPNGYYGVNARRTESAHGTPVLLLFDNFLTLRKNKARAFQVLRARLLDKKLQEDVVQRRETRRELVRSADRSEKIRTYNFVQDRVTDHRIPVTLKNIEAVMDGTNFQRLLDALDSDHRRGMIEDLSDEHVSN